MVCYRRLAIGDKGVNVLNAQARIRLVEADRRAVCSRCEVKKLLQVFSAGRRWRLYAEFEYQIEDLTNVLGEVGDVRIKKPSYTVKKLTWWSSSGTNCAKWGVPTLSRS
jgi:hypothetical protein